MKKLHSSLEILTCGNITENFSQIMLKYIQIQIAGIFVGVQFVKDMDHATIQNAVYETHLGERPAARLINKIHS